MTTTTSQEAEDKTIFTALTGYDLINDPRLNKGTAFTNKERDDFGLHGLLPPDVGSLEEQRNRRLAALQIRPTAFDKYALMRDLQDTNETLFYSLITNNITQCLPIVYTPTVGEGCERFSEIWRKPRGIFLSYPNRDKIAQIFADKRYDKIQCIVVSDGERILGLGDQGAGGMGIPIGKMALYTALAGIPPEACLPILLDVGTNNKDRLNDPLYVGWRHERVHGKDYDNFIESFVTAVKTRWPKVLLQWEDFAGSNAARILERYRNQLCTFNDDIQGTAAVTTATLLSAITVSGVALKDQRIAVLGFGSAGLGITNLIASTMQDEGLSEDEARERFYALDIHGLLVESGKDMQQGQQPYARKRSEVDKWERTSEGDISLEEVVRNAGITALIGVSGQAGAFTEQAVRAVAKNTDRPIIFPLSNPTSRSEATPIDLMKWTNGKALIGTGSPFDPVEVHGQNVTIDQTNNSYIFPGLALGIISSQSMHVSDTMIKAAAKALGALCPTHKDKKASLLPPMTDIRSISRSIAIAVGKQALEDKLTRIIEDDLEAAIDANIWEPVYHHYLPSVE